MSDSDRIKSIFSKYCDENNGCDVLDSCSRYYLGADEKSRKMKIRLELGRYFPFRRILEVSEGIKKAYNLNEIELVPTFAGTELDSERFLELADYLNDPFVKSMLKDAEIQLESKTVTVKTAVTSELLVSTKSKERLEAAVLRHYNEKKSVVFEYAEQPEPDEIMEKDRKEVSRLISDLPKTEPVRTAPAPKKDKGRMPKNRYEKKNVSESTLYGYDTDDLPLPIRELDYEGLRVCFQGEVFGYDSKEVKTTRDGKRYILIVNVTDFTNSVRVKLLDYTEKLEELKDSLKNGMCVKVTGQPEYDAFRGETIIKPISIQKVRKTERTDNAENKRVELHLHTNMSSMDGMTPVKDLVKRAASWGHKAVAVTDHGVVQSFPDAMRAGKDNGIKIIYGMEGYLIDGDTKAVYGSADCSLESEFVVFDLETTGLSPVNDRIIEIGAVKIKNGEITDRFSSYADPEMPVPAKITELTGISDMMLKGAPSEKEAVSSFLEFAGDLVLVAHNAGFDCGFMKQSCERLGFDFKSTYIDTVPLARSLFPHLSNHRLNTLSKHLGVRLENHHRAVDDCVALAGIFAKMLEILIKDRNISNIQAIHSIFDGKVQFKTRNYSHVILLVKSQAGMKNLYKIVSETNLNYLYRAKPMLPKGLLMDNREGLLIGTACSEGELYKAILDGKSDSELKELIASYDFLEVQPAENNRYLTEGDRKKLSGMETVRDINRRIIRLAEETGKLCVATGDVHFLDAKDEVFRRILMSGQGFGDAENQPPLYFKTTEEMLEDFSYLDYKTAYEVVVENPNKIADMIDEVSPVSKEFCPPVIEGDAEELVRLTYDRAASIYGDPLPEIVAARIKKELDSIIKHEFAVMYIIAERLVKKSLSDGYLVGSRGSVGSSLVAFLSGITEVNSLAPHYFCPKCRHSEFITDGSYDAGVDMPDKLCPECGQNMCKDGWNIPFETFLGFDGDKTPDIDLNFSGDYQPVAHKYIEELFGEGYVFRAGTIGTLAQKTAYGFVKKYFESRNQAVSKAETDRLVIGCTGIKRTTGQHPGGVIVVPKTHDINDFCPVQHPADDAGSDIITTHFDYHSIDQNLIKLDILGHDDPTMIRMLEDLTGVDAKKLPLADKKVLSLFTSKEALGMEDGPDPILREAVGALLIPEFGTRFVRGMLVDTKPVTVAELIRISGLSHGTDVWLNNAQELIVNKVTTLKEAICTRDDIMIYLMQKGLPAKESFSIMERVRKGKGLTEDNETLMRDSNVPEWYIESCKKISYMFPKAHAVAYVTMALRIAYFKVYYPLAFYCAYLSVRGEYFDSSYMIKGIDVVAAKIKEIEANDEATKKEEASVTVLEAVYEMYKRGFSFLPVDLYKSDAEKFIMADEKTLLPPLSSLQGVGVNAAQQIAEERKKGEFTSVESLKQRTGVSKTVIEIMQAEGVFKDIPESNQLSIFGI